MTSEQWQHVKELFEAALEHGQNDRTAFLVESCPQDGEVRAEVQSLLAAHERDSGFMNRPVGSLIIEEQSTLVPGQRLGNYETTSHLGKGGMGQVYLALDTRLGRKVALKLLPSSYAHNADHIQRLEQEARAASALNHPNIVTIHEIGEADSIHFMATEFVDGETLRQRMGNKDLSVREIVGIAVQIASALRAAHEASIVHRDIKPENIMLRRDGVVKVLDFGLAKLTSQQLSHMDWQLKSPSMVHTEAGAIMGTASYMSPEQARGESVDARTDVWSLGVVIFEMLSGRTPFTGETHKQAITSILENDPLPLTPKPDLPVELHRILGKALAKNRNDRYESAAEVASDLRILQEELNVLARLQRGSSGNRNQKEGVAERIGLDTVAHSATDTAKSHQRSRSINTYIRLIERHNILAGLVVILFVAALGWAYFAGDRNKNTATRRAIAVLPLKPVNSETRDDVYAIGIADALIRKLGELDGIVVRHVSTTRQYTDPGQDPIAAGKEQQVDYVLAASYELTGAKIRVKAELLNVRHGRVEQTYQIEKDASDVFAMQDAIAVDLGHKLLNEFATTSSQRAAMRGTNDREAYLLYLHGMYLANNRNLSDAKKAVEALEHAVQLDPNYAQAWAGLAYTHRTISLWSGGATTHETYQKSIAAINKALALDANLSEAHSALCENKYLYEWDFIGAERECKLAIELDANSAQAHEIYSRYLMGRGRHEEAIAEIETAIDLEPTSRFNHRNYGRALFYARRFKDAEEQFKRVLAMDQNFLGTYSWLTSTLALQGKESDAYEWFKKLLSARKVSEETAVTFERAFQYAGWRGVWREWVNRFHEIGGTNFDGAVYHAQLGNKEEAFKYLENVYQRREIWNTYLRVDPRLDPLRDDPRFADLLRRVDGN